MKKETNEENVGGLRERKKIKVYEDIESAALRLFLEQGYENTSIKQIADELMMSSRTFFRYYSSKEDLLTEPLRFIHNEGIKQVAQLDPDTTLQKALRLIFQEIASIYEVKRAKLLVRYQIAKQAPSTSLLFLYALLEAEPVMCEALGETLSDGPTTSQLKFEVAIHMAAFRVAAEEWLSETEGSVPLAEIIDGKFNRLMNE